MDLDKDYMKAAFAVAKESLDKSTKVGCVLVNSFGILATACNNFPHHVEVTPEREARPAKYDWVVHAEISVLAKTSRLGYSTTGCAVYTTQIPCSNCMGALINAGIRLIVCPSPHELQDKWKHNAEISIQMASEADVHLVYLEQPQESV